MTRATRLTEPIAGLGEGPYWDADSQQLIMVDLLRGDLLTISSDGGVDRQHVSDIVSVLRRRADGGFVIGVERGFAFLDDDLAPVGEPIPAFADPQLRMNDGGCDPQGRFYVGSMSYAEATGAGRLYRLDPDGSVSTVLDSVSVSNGIHWSADGQRVFYNDTPTNQVTLFDFDAGTGTLHDPRPFVSFTGPGSPDGMAIDVEDGIWVPLWGGSAVQRYDADGNLSEVVELPASKVTACAFGGPDRRRLHITTASVDLSPDEEPEAGAVFTVETGVTGATPYAFAG